jgi:hypothetical protein
MNAFTDRRAMMRGLLIAGATASVGAIAEEADRVLAYDEHGLLHSPVLAG